MRIIKTDTELVEYQEIDEDGTLYRRYSKDRWSMQIDDDWFDVNEVAVTRLEPQYNKLVMAMGRGSGKTMMNLAKMTPPLINEFWCVVAIDSENNNSETVLIEYARDTEYLCGKAVTDYAWKTEQYTGRIKYRLKELNWEIRRFQGIQK